MGQIIFVSENFFAVTQGSQPGTATIILVTPANWMWSLINSRITEKAFRADSGGVFDPKKQSNLSRSQRIRVNVIPLIFQDKY